MVLADLLQLLREAILNDRTDRHSGTSDYLWSDKTLITYINEAQRRFAVQGMVIRDGTTDEVTKIVLQSGVADYVLHESVIAVNSARIEGSHCDLHRVGHRTREHARVSDDWSHIPAQGSPAYAGASAYSVDEGMSDSASDSMSQIRLRVFPTPTTTGSVLRLRVIRKPIVLFSEATLGLSPEIPEDYHVDMLDWAAYLALRVVDDDAGSPNRAGDFKAMFEQNVRKARMDTTRKLHAPTPWGFGGGGFSWSN